MPPSGRVPGPAGTSAGTSSSTSSPGGHRAAIQGVFRGVKPSSLAFEVLQRAGHPELIHQNKSSLCGPASLSFLTATRHSPDYVKFVTDVYEKGEGSIVRLRVKPGEGCRNYCPPSNYMAGADWVALASIRDSENSIFNYDDVSDEFAGITLPHELVSWLEKADFSNVVDRTNLYLTKDEEHFRKAVDLHNAGHFICLLVDYRVVRGTEMRYLSQVTSLPDHWVVIRPGSTITMAPGGGQVDLEVFSWGGFIKVGSDDRLHKQDPSIPIDTKPNPMALWLQNYYGYVACTL